MVSVYVPNIAVERFLFFLAVGAVPRLSKAASFMGEWNAMIDPKIDKVGRGAWRLGRCESSLVDLMARDDLVDRFCLDHPGMEIWTWRDSSPSARVISCLDRVLEELTVISLVVPPSTWYGWLVRVSLQLANRPSLASYWKFNTSLLELRDFRDQLESLIKQDLVGRLREISGGLLSN